MRSAPFLLALALAIPAVALLGAPAAACDYWVQTTERTEVVGVGATAVGTVSTERSERGCTGESWESYCWNTTPVSVPGATLPGANTPEVRVLGQTVVPASTLPPTTVLAPQLVHVPYRDTTRLQECGLGPNLYGVYVAGAPAGNGSSTVPVGVP